MMKEICSVFLIMCNFFFTLLYLEKKREREKLSVFLPSAQEVGGNGKEKITN